MTEQIAIITTTTTDFDIGTTQLVIKNGKHYRGEIVGKRWNQTSWEYFVHYIDADRRLDEWVSHEKIISPITKSSNPSITTKKGNDSRASKRRKTASEKEGVKIRQTDTVVIGEHEIKCWYDSPYPDPYKNLNKLYVCEYCMKYMRFQGTYKRHRTTCKPSCPGKLIYENNKIRMYEVDGKNSKLYCQNLSLLTKLFIDDKSIYFDVESFLFYIVAKMEDKGIEHFVGFFSKEKISYDNYNLACVLVLPPFQKHGYGKLLIETSYELSKRENKIGSPEKPISDLGIIGFRSYWKRAIFRLIQNYLNNIPYRDANSSSTNVASPSPTSSSASSPASSPASSSSSSSSSSSITTAPSSSSRTNGNNNINKSHMLLSIKKISEETAISEDDVLDTLKEMGFLKYKNPKLGHTCKSKLKRKFDKLAEEHTPVICVTESMIDEYAKSQRSSKGQKTMLDPNYLNWFPGTKLSETTDVVLKIRDMMHKDNYSSVNNPTTSR